MVYDQELNLKLKIINPFPSYYKGLFFDYNLTANSAVREQLKKCIKKFE